MKKSILIFFSVFTLSLISALEVNRPELEGLQNQTIEFINYTGPHKVIDSLEAIKGIGKDLGSLVAKSTTVSTRVGSTSKYYVIHAVDASQKEKLDADILFIGQDATVDHITNLRRIISSYLSSAYGYSSSDADTLSVFITVYNAVYRGKLSDFQSKYKDIVTKNLDSANCGLSVNYKDWPGKSQIVIPLYDVTNGGLSTVDTSVISDSKVVDSMKDDDDKNIESRKEMVDIKEREADEAQKLSDQAQKKADEEKEKLEKEKEKTNEANKKAEEAQKKSDQKQQEASQAQKNAEEKEKIAEENPQDKEAQKEAEEAKKEALEKETEAEEAQKEADQAKEEAKIQSEKEEEQKKKSDEAQKEADMAQSRSDQKASEAQEERKEIAKDQNEVQKKEAAQANMSSEYGIVLTDEKELLSRLVKFNTETGETLKASPVTVIRDRRVFKEGDNYLAIAGENSGNGSVNLVLIDSDKMEIVSQSDLNIASDSVLIQEGSDYYCVIDDGGKYYLGKFGSDLSMKLKSSVQVKSCTPITITSSGIVITDSNGKLKLLSKSDLSDVSEGK